MDPFFKFVQNKIFNDRSVNVFCDRIYNALKAEFNEESDIDVTNHFLLSGRAAAIMQGEEYENVNNIIFQTDSQAIFDWLGQNPNSAFSGAKTLRFKNRVLVYPNQFILEIWFSDTALNPKTFENIKIQFKPEIPEILL